jgi:cell division transport system ATP-binding protein
MILFQQVTKTYLDNWKALDNVSFKINSGEFVFLIGHSGAGKTTLLRHIYMDERPDDDGGQVMVSFHKTLVYDSKTTPEGKVQDFRRHLGIVFQDFKLLTDRDVFENIAFTLRIQGVSGRKMKEKVYSVMARTGLSHKRRAMPHTLSGGEQQRVAIARAIVNEPYALLADEPTGNLDPENAERVFEILKDINAGGTSVLMATHNPSIYENSPFRKLCLDHGKLKTREFI